MYVERDKFIYMLELEKDRSVYMVKYRSVFYVCFHQYTYVILFKNDLCLMLCTCIACSCTLSFIEDNNSTTTTTTATISIRPFRPHDCAAAILVIK